MSITQELAIAFKERFGTEPTIYRSPGRVNLIGEHTDYNNGFVLPAAIDKAVYLAIDKRDDDQLDWFALDMKEAYQGSINAVVKSEQGWPNYVLGVIDQLQQAGHQPGGFNLMITADLPVGAGLSSSAAIECATIFALNDLYEFGIDKITMVKMAQKAEHQFAGVMCGIMDQFASMMGLRAHAIKLDCGSLEYEYIPLHFNDIDILLFDSKVKHSLASTEYNIRRSECEMGVSLLRKIYPEVESLRDVTLEMIEAYLTGQGKIYDRCRFVVEENARLLEACEDLRNDDPVAFGAKMYETHEGLSKLYEVSCKELDFLVECARQEPAILGSRMMGGGFGGCTINLVKREEVEQVSQRISAKYQERFGVKPEIYHTTIDSGTNKIG